MLRVLRSNNNTPRLLSNINFHDLQGPSKSCPQSCARGLHQKLQAIFRTLVGKPSRRRGLVILSWPTPSSMYFRGILKSDILSAWLHKWIRRAGSKTCGFGVTIYGARRLGMRGGALVQEGVQRLCGDMKISARGLYARWISLSSYLEI